MHDAYFGVSVNGEHTWLNQLRRVSYEEQSNIILAQDSFQGLNLSVRYFAPFELEANALIMMLSIENQSSESVTVNTAAKVNLNLEIIKTASFPQFAFREPQPLKERLLKHTPAVDMQSIFPSPRALPSTVEKIPEFMTSGLRQVKRLQ